MREMWRVRERERDLTCKPTLFKQYSTQSYRHILATYTWSQTPHHPLRVVQIKKMNKKNKKQKERERGSDGICTSFSWKTISAKQSGEEKIKSVKRAVLRLTFPFGNLFHFLPTQQ